MYGTGVKMPVGYMTRLAAQSKPSWWGTNQGEFKDLHTSHILKLNVASATGVEFFQALIGALAVADPTYSQSGEPTWVMNRKTHMDILARALAFNAAGALVGRHEQHHAGDRRSDRGAPGRRTMRSPAVSWMSTLWWSGPAPTCAAATSP